MVSQVVFIHGGETFDSYSEYLEAFSRWVFDPNKGSEKRWKHHLAERISPVEVLAPTMPNKYNAKYVEWKLWFEKVIPFIKDDVVLVGHSLGGLFLTKYLSENELPHRITATLIVAAPHSRYDSDYSLADFVFPESTQLLMEQGGSITLYHSTDDPIVPFIALEKYKKALPTANVKTFEDRGHFMQEEFPEITEDILALR